MLSTVEAFRALVRPLPLSPGPFAPAEAVRAAIDLARQESGLAEAVMRRGGRAERHRRRRPRAARGSDRRA